MFYDRFSVLCACKGVSATYVCRSIGVQPSNITAWKKGVLPNNSTLKKVAEYFSVPVSYFTDSGAETTVTGNNNQIGNGNSITYTVNEDSAPLSETEKALLSLFRSLSPIQQAYEITRLDGIVNSVDK